MPLPALPDSKISKNKPFEESVAKQGYRDRDDTIYALVLSFFASLLTHSHNGDPDQGQPIGTPGIAADAVNASDMFAANSIGPTEIASNTMGSSDFDGHAVTSEKISGHTGSSVSGTWSYDVNSDPLPGGGPSGNDEFIGQSKTVTNPLSPKRKCIVTADDTPILERGEWNFRKFDANNDIVIGLNTALVVARYGETGTANYYIKCM